MTVRKTIKWCCVIVLLVGAVGGGYGYWFVSNANQLLLERVREEFAKRAPGWDIQIGSAKFDWNRRVHLYDVTLKVKGDDSPLARLPEIVLVVNRDKLANDQEFIIQRVQLLSPEFTLVRDEQGGWNWQKLPALPKSEQKSSLPELAISDAKINVTLNQSENRPPARMRLHSTEAKFVPSSKRSYDIELATEIGESGTMISRGNWNIDARTWSVNGKIKQITSSGELLGLAVGASPELRYQIARLETKLLRMTPPEDLPPTKINSDALPDFGATGTLDVAFDFSRKDRTKEPEFGIVADIHRANLSNPAFPFPLHDITGRIRWDNNRASLENLQAQNGLTNITINGEIRREGISTPSSFDIVMKNLPLDSRLYKRLPKSWKEELDILQPTGHVDITGRVRYDGVSKWTPSGFVLTANNCTGAHREFPYRIRQINGTITQRQNVFDIQISGLAGRQKTTLSGYIRNPGPQSESLFDLAVRNFPIDDTFLAACQPDVRNTIRSMGFKGLANTRYRISRLNPRNRIFRHQIIADFKDGSVEYEGFPYRLKKFSGRLTYDTSDEVWNFIDLKASNGKASFTGAGTLTKLDGKQYLKLKVISKNASFDNELRRAMPKFLETVWADTKPTGQLDFITDLRWIAGQPVDIALSDVKISDGSLLLKALPISLEKVQAKISYVNGRMTIHSFRARHNNTLVRIDSGFLDQLANGEWKLRLIKFYVDDILPDRRFRRALGKDLRTVVEELDPQGLISVSGMLELRGTGNHRDPVTAAWDLKFLLSGNSLSAGLPLKNIHGSVIARGTWDGRRVEMLKGNQIEFSSVSLWGYQFSRIRGPYKIVGKQIIVGSAAALPTRTRPGPLRPIPMSDRITAKAIGGDFTLDGVVLLEKVTSYQMSLTMRKTRLEQYARRYLRGENNLDGVMYGRIDLYGRGKTARNITGQGKLLISPAALYELPVLAQIFQIIKFVPPDKTAFKYAFADFQVLNSQFLFNKIDLVGDSISMRGRGKAGFNGNIEFDFYSMMPKNQITIPIISQLVSTATNAWVGVKVRGTTRRPVPELQAAPQIDNALKRFLGAFGTSPGSTGSLFPWQAHPPNIRPRTSQSIPSQPARRSPTGRRPLPTRRRFN